MGLYHIGIKVGDSLDELRAAKQDLEKAGVKIGGMSDHTVSQSLYLHDPDGNEVEVYVDADPAIWKNDPRAAVAPIKPLHAKISRPFDKPKLGQTAQKETAFSDCSRAYGQQTGQYCRARHPPPRISP